MTPSGTNTLAGSDTLKEGSARAILVPTDAPSSTQCTEESTHTGDPVVITGPRPKVEEYLERMRISVTALLEVATGPSWQTSPDIRAEFDALAAEWLDETFYMSSLTDISVAFPYQRIIGLGPAALPLILERLEQRPQHWFWALEAITGKNPIAPEHIGSLPEMANDWLEWARDNGVVLD